MWLKSVSVFLLAFLLSSHATVAVSRKHNLVKRSAFSAKLNNVTEKISSVEKPSVRVKNPRISFSKTSDLTPIASNLFKCPQKKSAFECVNKTSEFKNKLLLEFTNSLERKSEQNAYNVDYRSETNRNFSNPSICPLMKSKIKLVQTKDPPFNILKLGQLIPKQRQLKRSRGGKSCVIVSSAGSLTGSNLGNFIDNHDIVMRFNHAPTEGYEIDVGNKTTIRIVNSQVVSKAEFNFLTSPLFKNISLVAWDPGKFNETLEKWYNNPDFDLFTNYQRFMEENPNADFHLINPRSLWSLWRVLQDATTVPIPTNPPSSGFIGIAMLVPICSHVDVVEYVPSTRLNGKCHYYSSEINARCTFGAWHPLAAEKLFSYRINSADDFTVFQRGIIRIRPDQKIC